MFEVRLTRIGVLRVGEGLKKHTHDVLGCSLTLP